MGHYKFCCAPARIETGLAIEGDWNRLIGLFREHSASRLPNRRTEERHPAAECPAWAGWWVDARDFRITRARLLNISRGGAMVLLGDSPPVRDAMWICLGTPEPVDCAQATVLEVQKNGENQSPSVRLAFRAPCSDTFFRAAVRTLAREARLEALATGPGD